MKKPRISKKLLIPGVLMMLGLGRIASALSSPNEKALRDRAVKLVSKEGSCSGVQIHAPHGSDYLLTAGHCKILADDKGYIEAITEDGVHIKRRVITEDDKSDLLLLEGIPGLRGLDMAKKIWKTEHVRTFTHGGGLDTYKTEGQLIQGQQLQVPMEAGKECSMPKYKKTSVETLLGPMELCVLDVWETLSTAKIISGSSGGMLVDDAGDLVGVASADGEHVNAFVYLGDIHRFMDAY